MVDCSLGATGRRAASMGTKHLTGTSTYALKGGYISLLDQEEQACSACFWVEL